ncbi:hypothetical protein NQZ68_035595 [Dissostichus eleginoides]|nr:hypothetical protein NQZ68_035595 [Dissostichus eleginoides]
MLLPFTLKITAELGQHHHMTSLRQEKDFSHFTSSENSFTEGSSYSGTKKKDQEIDSTDIHADIVVVLIKSHIVPA